MAVVPEDWKVHICALVLGTGETFADEMARRLHAKGYEDIPIAHGRNVMRHLDYEGTRLTDLADRSRMTKQAVGELVDHLVGLGYVERRPDPRDGRAKLVVPTERGRQAKDAAHECLMEIDAEWTERLGEERMELLRRMLAELQTPFEAPEPAGQAAYSTRA
jgi:DNA-binding MarR family transcriptional regulator